MAPEPVLLHGARTGAGDTVLDTALLVLPLLLFGLMVFGPRLLAWYRDLKADPRDTAASKGTRPKRPGPHGGEPI